MTGEVQGGDTAWVLVSAALVLLMMPGLAFFYGGLVRAKSVLNTLMMTVGALGVVTVLWVSVGYSLAFGPGSAWIGGLAWARFAGVGAAPVAAYAPTIPHAAFAAFQGMFAAITVAIVSGAVVERMRFGAYLAFAALWSLLVYAPLAHWVWGDGGWLRALGALDFAGGTVVHISAGTAAVVAAAALGRRRDFGRPVLVPHNVPFTVLGALLLWCGWFGFNAGSALGATPVAALALATTHVAAAAALVTWMGLDLVRHGHATAVGAATGAVVGLVAITPAAGFVSPSHAVLVGVLGALASYGALLVRARSKLDDALDVFACHGVAGIVGALLTGVFASSRVNPAAVDGWAAGGGLRPLWVQGASVLATMAFVGAATALILAALRAAMPLRVSVADEIAGVDGTEHGESAYEAGDSLGELVGRRAPLGASVVLPVDVAPGTRR